MDLDLTVVLSGSDRVGLQISLYGYRFNSSFVLKYIKIIHTFVLEIKDNQYHNQPNIYCHAASLVSHIIDVCLEQRYESG